MFRIPCSKCNGKGIIPHFSHVDEGLCFQCSGSMFQEVNEEEYQDYLKHIERIKQGSYILFNNGKVEYYSTVSEINKKYGNFYCGNYAERSMHVAYRDKDIVYTKNKGFKSKEVNKIKNWCLTERLGKLKQMLEKENDIDFRGIIISKIQEYEQLLC